MRTQTRHLPDILFAHKEGIKVAGRTLHRGEPLQWRVVGLTARKVMQMLAYRMLTPQRPGKAQQKPKKG